MSPSIATDQLQPVLRDLRVAPAVGVVEMQGGSAPTFQIDLADGERLVLKTYLDELLTLPAKEAFAAAQLQGLGIPVTQYLLMDESRTRLPFRFAITNYLPGSAARNLMDDPGISEVYRQMGALLRKLHQVGMEGYGRLDAHGVAKPVETNAEYMHATIDSAFVNFRHLGGDAALADRLRAIVESRFEAIVTHSTGPVFAHDDLHQGNVLVDRSADGKLYLSGLIDFGNARAADAVFDLAKCLFCSAHEDSRSYAPILEGYGEIDHPAPEAALWYYTLLHRMTMWGWLRRMDAIPTADTPNGLIDDLKEMAEA